MTNIPLTIGNIIYILFPFLCYLIYIAYCNDINKKESSLLLSVVLFISMYLSIHFEIKNFEYIPIMFNIPLAISYLKNKNESIIAISIFIIIIYKVNYDIPLTITILEYIGYFIIFSASTDVKKNHKYICAILFCILKSTTYIMYIINLNQSIIISNLIQINITFILSTVLIIKLLEKSENIVNLNITIKELEREKQLRNSLFNIAHEIKNPLAVCKGYLEMINEKNREKYIPIIQNELKRSITLMNDMLDFTHIKIEPDYMDINVLLEDIRECINPLIKNKNIKINMKLSKEEIYIYADYIRLKQVFIDIIKNSVEDFDKTKKQRIINIDVTLKRNKIITTIKDNGKGMTIEDLDELKKPIYTPGGRNKALGITLINEIIKGHKGEIECFSKINKGTTTIVTLPYKA